MFAGKFSRAVSTHLFSRVMSTHLLPALVFT